SLPHLRITGMDCHIGSQLTETSPFIAAAEKILLLVDALASEGIHLEHLDLGGGLGICYHDETPPPIAEYVAALLGVLRGRGEKLILEPGRVLVGNAGGIDVSLNGKDVGPLGPPGRVRIFRFTPEGHRPVTSLEPE
ncbi:MAG: DUF4115 domain-containing protein, partial [Acidobacteria bacterium]|nr:DUF4115 domain-containing protein [Acidobacteriota bacterium]